MSAVLCEGLCVVGPLNISLIISEHSWCSWPIKKRQAGSQQDEHQPYSLSLFLPAASQATRRQESSSTGKPQGHSLGTCDWQKGAQLGSIATAVPLTVSRLNHTAVWGERFGISRLQTRK